ncbi:uncharacterized protein LOC127444817 [Myxocyprinus asiaticus]|uniref:uncharacterized protein LOC127444817 n=1 Tax=Myxocyprinus asiaticus TaxID=70543 RepID=UPI0022226A66|nr:uncharacterized protein LOC127444817 [Myxocyprinus asiaticus]
MSLNEESKEGTASKTSSFEQKEEYGANEYQMQRAASPASSFLSMKSDDSMMRPPEFSDGAETSDPRINRRKSQEAACPVSSCLSMKSDDSMMRPPEFSDGAVPSGLSSTRRMRKRESSPEPSCVSMKSDNSINAPPKFSDKAVTSDLSISRRTRKRESSPKPSCVSMKSDNSINAPPKFSDKAVTSDLSISRRTRKRESSPEPSCVSMKSDDSMMRPPEFRDGAVISDPSWEMNETKSCQTHIRQHNTGSDLQEKTEGLHQDSHHDVLQRVKDQHKTSMKNKYESLFEGIKLQGNQTLLNKIYTQLYIIEGESEGVNEEHEVLHMEKTARTQHLQDTPIYCNDIFKPLPEPGCEKRKDQIKSVLTKGIAGIGKTVSVQKFILDWAEGNANQDVDFMFVLPFRELNLIKDEPYSLHKLLLDFHPELHDLDTKIYDECKVVFIFDGLDESRIPLMFSDSEKVSDVTETSSVSVLMSNLIKGDLLPSALIWITSRPAAANQIPSKYIKRVTEIQGFNDPQKEEYFRKRISDEHQASRIISHIRRARSLHIMCHIPVFCWISSTVLQNILKQDDSAEIPQTLTEMYIHFLLIQINMRNQKYEERDPEKLLQSNSEVIVKLAELAFKQLMKGNVMFYEEDLRESGIDVTDASVYSGICTEIFKEESVIHQRKVYCFIHLSFQEFLAAFNVFYCYLCSTKEALFDSLHNLHKRAVDKALQSANGHLDLFLRFLLGISLVSNQRLLQDLLTHNEDTSEDIKKTTKYIKNAVKNDKRLSADQSINLFLCQLEMKDQTLYREIHKFLKSDKNSIKNKLTPAQCSAIAYMLQMSEEVLDELDLKKYNTSEEGRRRLIPAVSNSRKALLANCNLTGQHYEIVASALQSSNSVLRELDLSNNDLQDSGVKLLSDALKNTNCTLEILRLSGCMVTEAGCCYLASALRLNPSHLIELDLSYNHPGESGVNLLSERLSDPNCKLNKLNVDHNEPFRIRPGLQKYLCDLTLDPNTAHPSLKLSEGNKKVTYVKEVQSYPDHPERFENQEQVLSKESLSGRCYWEAELGGEGRIAVTYKTISRKQGLSCRFGLNEQSWCLYWIDRSDVYAVWHNNKNIDIPAPSPPSNRAALYLDWSAGTLSFYSVSDTHTLTHLHTFNTTFTEPLYAGFRLFPDSPVSLCQFEKSQEVGVTSSKMSLNEDKDERTHSKTSFCEQKEEYVADQYQMQRTASSGSSCLSIKSEEYMRNLNPVSSDKAETSDLSITRKNKKRGPFPEPSCVPMMSDDSMKHIPVYSDGAVTSDPSWEINEMIRSVKTCQTHIRKQNTESVHPTHTLLEETENQQQDPHQAVDDVLQRVKDQHKTSMKNKYESLFEGIKLQENQTLLNRIYTQLYIIEGESEGVNEEHEVLHMEKTARNQHLQDNPIYCNDIFKPLPEPGCEEKRKYQIKSVLTKGIAGIGKTVSVQKFILDWAEGKANQDVDFMFVLPFRELNLIKDEQYSLHKLLLDFHPELHDLDTKIYDECKVLFIFDGLDESRIPLMFSDSEKVSDVTETSSVGVLMSNLIKGDLLPSALIWITSRPAAANQIPSKYIKRVTEIQGFSDLQKEEYFRKKISDEHQASRIISHIRRARSLHIMCHIPVFCWISSTVLQNILKQDDSAEIPQTLTEMFIHFLLIQINMRNQKYEERDPEKLLQSNREVIVKLAELSFKQLMKGNVMFYEEDLRESGIDITDASEYSGICIEIFKEESVIHQRKVYSFIHLSFQEFLAALYVFYCYLLSTTEALFDSLHNLHKRAVDKALQSANGHLDLFLRFLLGISLESNQRLLQDLLTHTENSSESIKKSSQYIKDKIKGQSIDDVYVDDDDDNNDDELFSAERSINLFLCQLEMKDQTLYREIQEFLKSDKHSESKLSPAQCSAIAYMLQMSEEVLDELDLKKYNTSEEGRRRLIPAVSNCRKALLANCNLTGQHCETVASALQLSKSLLRELDLSNNDLQDSGVKLLSDSLKSTNCTLEILRLSGCMVTEVGCCYLASALRSNPSHLIELDLSYNNPGESGVNLLSERLSDPNCKLNKLNVDHNEPFRIRSGLQKYHCDLTLDPNTAHPSLKLSEGNKKVTHVEEVQSYPDHPDRFENQEQILCRESLSGRCYWAAELGGEGRVAVTYKGISRKQGINCRFGLNEQSWSLYRINSGNVYTVWHNNKTINIPAPSPPSNRVGVYLDWSAGTLSFYSVSDADTLTHLHTFHSTFTEPLYAGFRLYPNSPVSLCQIENHQVRNN